MTLPRWAAARRHDEQGFTLIELLVSCALFAIFLALLAAATSTMLTDVRRQQARADGLDGNRKALALLDRQTRYANAITVPGTNAGGADFYVEWREGNSAVTAQQTCYQWRLQSASHTLSYRTWLPPAAAASSWSTQVTHVDPAGGQPFALVPGAGRQALAISYASTRGNPAVTTSSSVTFTARNTISSAPTPGICTEAGRP